MISKPLVSVIIPTYNRKKMARSLVKSLVASTYKKLEIIVIDDASTDGTSEYLKSSFVNDKRIRIYRNKVNLFAAGSKNIGQSKARGELIAFIDDDNIVDRRMIEELVKIIVNNADVGEVGPVNYVHGGNKILLTKSTRSMWTTKTTHARSLENSKKRYWETDDIPNAFMVKKEIVQKSNIKFNKRYGIMYEESDYAYRIREAGFKILFVRDAKIYHKIDRKDKDYISHFLSDSRRPFVFARNRVLFHSHYSSKIQNLFIVLFWIWFFSAFYALKFFFYKDEKISKSMKVKAIRNYFKGTMDGVTLIILRKNLAF